MKEQHVHQFWRPGAGSSELQKAIEELVESGFVGVQFRVNGEQGEWVGSAGVSKLGQSARPLTNGHFRIGSSTKNFIATSVLLLVAEVRIGLDAPADDYLPEFGLDRRITVRMMLQHTSGIFNHTGELYEDGTIVLLVSRMCQRPLGPGAAGRSGLAATWHGRER
ncbi:serine hydrolase domain-containing protein [Streptomyces sp. NPDC058067]|uniref:serine hydrolase domain-containing protein n=1 Tax=Streptomyces sp. NPDC058067 TaxID=3346324 RepID=UPI0036F0B2C3